MSNVIKHTITQTGEIYGYDDNPASQELAQHRVTQERHVIYEMPVPTDAELLAAAKAKQFLKINASCAASIVSGQSSSALGTPHMYPSAAIDQQNLSANVLASLFPGLAS